MRVTSPAGFADTEIGNNGKVSGNNGKVSGNNGKVSTAAQPNPAERRKDLQQAPISPAERRADMQQEIDDPEKVVLPIDTNPYRDHHLVNHRRVGLGGIAE